MRVTSLVATLLLSCSVWAQGPGDDECACPVVASAWSTDVPGINSRPSQFKNIQGKHFDSTEVGVTGGIAVPRGKPIPWVAPTFRVARLADVTNVTVEALAGDCDEGAASSCDGPLTGCSVRLVFNLTMKDPAWIGSTLTAIKDGNGVHPQNYGKDEPIIMDTGTVTAECYSFMSGGSKPAGEGLIEWGGPGWWNGWWDFAGISVRCRGCKLDWNDPGEMHY